MGLIIYIIKMSEGYQVPRQIDVQYQQLMLKATAILGNQYHLDIVLKSSRAIATKYYQIIQFAEYAIPRQFPKETIEKFRPGILAKVNKLLLETRAQALDIGIYDEQQEQNVRDSIDRMFIETDLPLN